jgi:hypothetical protein
LNHHRLLLLFITQTDIRLELGLRAGLQERAAALEDDLEMWVLLESEWVVPRRRSDNLGDSRLK